MKQIDGKYRRLKPSIEYLCDEVVIAQAWKKTHGYIRAFNWYADTLALDISALGIEENTRSWGKQLREGRSLYPLELVPAAKSEAWLFDNEGWHPKNDKKRKKNPPIRPLAHITIRDQTWASAAMLCLADAVETKQGDCSHKNQSFEEARNKGIFSYGNRLVCDWNEYDEGWFRWGNSETYRKFFTDYQNFLKRPLELGRLISEHSFDSEDVYIVNLDLQKFYNTINIEELILRLKEIVYSSEGDICEEFWVAFEKITDWKWNPSDLKYAKELNLGDMESGLPQGLVASGFFANAYLANFDAKVGEKLGNPINKASRVILHDYCRYVDDLRLVVSADGLSAQQVRDKINEFFSKLLILHGGAGLKINPDKTKVTLLSDLDSEGSMANRIEAIQSELSGPTSRDALDAATVNLESLLSVEDSGLPGLNEAHTDAPLLNIANFDHDIRPDTLKRFAANRLESIVQSKRAMRDESSAKSGRESNEDELLAKKLVYAWMKDPSLALVLRKAIEIYPEVDLFEPVFDSIFKRSSFSQKASGFSKITAVIMDYLLADLFRCAIDFNGYFQVIAYSDKIRPQGVIELITRYAQRVVTSKIDSPFVLRQALMLLAVTGKPTLVASRNPTIQHDLHVILVSAPPKYHAQRAALFEVAAQITDQFDTFASLFLKNIKNLGDKRRAIALEVFAKRGGPFWLALWKKLSKDRSLSTVVEQLKWAAPLRASQPKPRTQLLSKVISSEDNGFAYEHSQIRLALALIKLAQTDDDAIERSPNELKVSRSPSGDWGTIWSPQVNYLICKLSSTTSIQDPRFRIPGWVGDDGDNRAIYWIGMILRASVLGGTDFTGNKWRQSKTTTYKGLRTSWYKRRMGMMHSPESLVGEYSTISNWYSNLLMRCLQWPGFESTYVNHEDVRRITDIDTLKKCLKARLNYLTSIVCKSSALPMIPTDIERVSRKSGFRIVTVQQLLPKTEDFSKADVGLNNPAYRAKHQEHLRDVCTLTVNTLEAKLRADGNKTKPSADLIVFPEVAVHIDDQAIIKRLADKTGAIVFAGLVFTDVNGKTVNVARWFIPDYRESGRQWIIRDQGKQHLTAGEEMLGVSGYRPCQHLIKVHGDSEGPFRLTGAICYDATDIKLAADLKDKTDLFIISAHNKDVNTFDNMASALHYHMYQHVVISNIGEFGGSTIQAPFKQPYDRLISHVHGLGQISINTADIDLAAFRRKSTKYKEVKTKPAGS